MSTQICALIDFATGENWELPLYLYQKYQLNCTQLPLKELTQKDETIIQYWLTTLTTEERSQVTKK